MGLVQMEDLHALVEADRGMDEGTLERLLAATYRASVRRASAVFLRGIAPTTVDGMLDPVVRAEGPRVAGVRYLTDREEEVFLEAAARAGIVIAGDALRERLGARKVRALGPTEGIRALRHAADRRGDAGGRRDSLSLPTHSPHPRLNPATGSP